MFRHFEPLEEGWIRMSLSHKTAVAFMMDDVLETLVLRTKHKPKKLRSSLKRWLRKQYALPLTNGERLCLFRPLGVLGVDHIRIDLLDNVESDKAVELIPWHSQSAGHWLDRFIGGFPLPRQKRSNRGPRNQLVQA